MQTVQMLNSILDALMTISVKGADTITMGNVLQALQQLINAETEKQQSQQQFIPEEKEAE